MIWGCAGCENGAYKMLGGVVYEVEAWVGGRVVGLHRRRNERTKRMQ